MLDWIPQFFEKLTCIIPRLVRVPTTHRLVKWSWCQEISDHGPGIHWYWPVVTEMLLVDMRWKSCVNYVQTVTMQDGTTVSARAMTVWRPYDLTLMVGQNEDYADRVAETSLSTVVDVLCPLSAQQLKCVGALNYALTAENRTQLAACGIEVVSSKFTELAVSPAYRLINDSRE